MPYFGAAGGQCHPGRDLADRSGRTGPLHRPFYAARGGGTDFRPAFARIAELREQGELRDLQGVLYFTDGKGIYPAHRPPFETAFLFLEDGAPPPEVPPWAMRLILQPEEFESIKQHDRKAPPKG